MNKERTVFSQVVGLLSQYEFKKSVDKYSLGILPRKFSFYDQFLSMAYAQLTFRESLRDIETCLMSLGSKAYHMGFRCRVTRSTLAYANDTRDWRIWHDLAQNLIIKARKLYSNDSLEVQFAQAAYAIDSSTITLCLTLFPWARYQKKVKAIKIHTQLELRGNIPSFILISRAKMNDILFLDKIILEPGAMYVMDRGYFDFQRFFRFTTEGAFFITRLKSNVGYKRTKIFYRNHRTAIRCDTAIVPLAKKAQANYPQHLRLVEYYDPETSKKLIFITNNFTLSAQSVADFYRSRWKVELFFKWIKQNLRIKAFFGTSKNAVYSQIWIAVSVYLLVAILKKQLNLPHSLHTILQALSACATEKIPLLWAFRNISENTQTQNNYNQLDLF